MRRSLPCASAFLICLVFRMCKLRKRSLEQPVASGLTPMSWKRSCACCYTVVRLDRQSRIEAPPVRRLRVRSRLVAAACAMREQCLRSSSTCRARTNIVAQTQGLRATPRHSPDFGSSTAVRRPLCSGACKLCEASYPNTKSLRDHLDAVHGGEQRAREVLFFLEKWQPHVMAPSEQRASLENFSYCFNHSADRRELKPYASPLPLRMSRSLFLCDLYSACHTTLCAKEDWAPRKGQRPPVADVRRWKAQLLSNIEVLDGQRVEAATRQFVACAFCAMQRWSEEL